MSVVGELLLLLPHFFILVSPLRGIAGVVGVGVVATSVSVSAEDDDDDDDKMVLCLSVKVKLPHSATVPSWRAGGGDWCLSWEERLRRVTALALAVGVVTTTVPSVGLVISIKFLLSKSCEEFVGCWFLFKSHLFVAVDPKYSSRSEALPLERRRDGPGPCCGRVHSRFARVVGSSLLISVFLIDSFGDMALLLEKQIHF